MLSHRPMCVVPKEASLEGSSEYTERSMNHWVMLSVYSADSEVGRKHCRRQAYFRSRYQVRVCTESKYDLYDIVNSWLDGTRQIAICHQSKCYAEDAWACR